VRTRIATDLHDDVGSGLSQIAILSEVARQQAVQPASSVAQPLVQIANVSRELVDSMSDIVWAINPKRDRLSDLSQRMRELASDLFPARNIDFRLCTPSAEQNIKLDPEIRRQLFLVFKESINNMVSHSGCTGANIQFVIENPSSTEPERQRLRIRSNPDRSGKWTQKYAGASEKTGRHPGVELK
jgi:signal transduction histidine kinase